MQYQIIMDDPPVYAPHAPWQEHVTYNLSDIVSYDHHVFKCTRAHRSFGTCPPDSASNLWQDTCCVIETIEPAQPPLPPHGEEHVFVTLIKIIVIIVAWAAFITWLWFLIGSIVDIPAIVSECQAIFMDVILRSFMVMLIIVSVSAAIFTCLFVGNFGGITGNDANCGMGMIVMTALTAILTNIMIIWTSNNGLVVTCPDERAAKWYTANITFDIVTFIAFVLAIIISLAISRQ